MSRTNKPADSSHIRSSLTSLIVIQMHLRTQARNCWACLQQYETLSYFFFSLCICCYHIIHYLVLDARWECIQFYIIGKSSGSCLQYFFEMCSNCCFNLYEYFKLSLYCWGPHLIPLSCKDSSFHISASTHRESFASQLNVYYDILFAFFKPDEKANKISSFAPGVLVFHVFRNTIWQ